MPYYVMMFLWGIVCLILQSTLFSQLMIAGVKPDLLLILVIFNCLFQGHTKAVLSVSLGLLEDLYLGSYIGMNALTKALTSLVGGWLLKGFSGKAFSAGVSPFR